MKEAGATLFPHSLIGEHALERITRSFSPISLCLPYFMEPPETAKGRDSKVRILFPPAQLQPESDFKRVLREYQGWMEQHRDKGYAAVLTLIQQDPHDEDSWWGIRKMIQQKSQGPAASSPVKGLKWHLILHLARQIEEAHAEAGRLLERLRMGPSPLSGAIEEGQDIPGPMSDLAPQALEILFSGHQLHQVLEAWFGLFGTYLPSSGTLITLSCEVWDFVKGLFEGIAPTSFQSKGLTSLRLPVPERPLHQDPLLEVLSGKTLVLYED